MLKIICSLLLFGHVDIGENVKAKGGGHPVPDDNAITVNLYYEF